jgi:hypothetical protein
MNSHSGDPEQDPDLPIGSLKEQEQETAPDFMSRVRNKIQRRTTANQFASYSWHLPKLVLIEMVSVLTHIFTAINGKKESER